MKLKLFRGAVIFALMLLLLAAGTALLLIPDGTDLLGELPHLIAAVILLILVALLGSWALSVYITKPLASLPEEHTAYPELAGVITRLHEQERTIRHQEETLSRERQDFAAITGNLSEGFVLVDKKLNIVSKNAAAERLLPKPDPEGRDNLGSRECPASVLRAVSDALAGRRTEQTMKKDERVYYVIASPVLSGGQITGAVLIALDDTEREERESLRREFSANVSHELKTPLTSIAGFAELLANGMVPPERTAEFGGDIYKEAQRLIALVEDIIELSRLEENVLPREKEAVDLYALSARVLGELAGKAEHGQVTLCLQGEHIAVCGVPTAIEELIFNLCDNAVKYNRPGGRVIVSTENLGRELCLSVEDTGIGIPFEHQSRVFERFYRVDKSHSRHLGGTGLGLSIVRHAAQLHHARLELQSEPDVGTKITVFFPMAETM